MIFLQFMRNRYILFLIVSIFAFFFCSHSNVFEASCAPLSYAEKVEFVTNSVALVNQQILIPGNLVPFSLTDDQLQILVNNCSTHEELVRGLLKLLITHIDITYPMLLDQLLCLSFAISVLLALLFFCTNDCRDLVELFKEL